MGERPQVGGCMIERMTPRRRPTFDDVIAAEPELAATLCHLLVLFVGDAPTTRREGTA